MRRRTHYFMVNFQQYFYDFDSLLADYKAEIDGYNEEDWEPAQRAARLSAAVKRFKTSTMIFFLLGIMQQEEASGTPVDMTPVMAKKLCKAFFGRTGSQRIIVSVFGDQQRSRKNPEHTPELIAYLIEKYQEQADRKWLECLKQIEEVKVKYRLLKMKVE